MRSSEREPVVSGQLEVAPAGSTGLRQVFPRRFEPKVIVNRRALMPTRMMRVVTLIR